MLACLEDEMFANFSYVTEKNTELWKLIKYKQKFKLINAFEA